MHRSCLSSTDERIRNGNRCFGFPFLLYQPSSWLKEDVDTILVSTVSGIHKSEMRWIGYLLCVRIPLTAKRTITSCTLYSIQQDSIAKWSTLWMLCLEWTMPSCGFDTLKDYEYMQSKLSTQLRTETVSYNLYHARAATAKNALMTVGSITINWQNTETYHMFRHLIRHSVR